MQLRRIVISFSLLLAYTVGLAGNLSPYCNYGDYSQIISNNTPEEASHRHEHHQHDQKNATSHEHFIHEGHYDNGVFDFIICLLSESEHLSNEFDYCYYIPVNSDDPSSDWLYNVNYVTSLLVIFNEAHPETNFTRFNTEELTSYLSPNICDTPLRGPPLSSC